MRAGTNRIVAVGPDALAAELVLRHGGLETTVRSAGLQFLADGATPVVVAARLVNPEGKPVATAEIRVEPDETEVLDAIIPKYVSSLIYGAFLEAVASENGARMTAMDSASRNADKMLSELNTYYNRIRQSAITQEITEISAGARAQKTKKGKETD